MIRKIYLCAALSVFSGLLISGGAALAQDNIPYSMRRTAEMPDVSRPVQFGPFAGPYMPAPEEKAVQRWGYGGASGPARWGDLDPAFRLCKTGTRQSPINIATFFQEKLPALEADYKPVPLKVANAGHTLRVGSAPGSGFSVDGFRYELRRIEFHTPSEHYMDGASWPMEAQFVHQGSDGSLAIIAVMIKAGKQNPTFEGILQNLPANPGAVRDVDAVDFLADALMPEKLDYYAYDGSLTAPPCTEGVRWFVLKDQLEISEDQIRAFQARFPFNARPVQPLNGRVITGG